MPALTKNLAILGHRRYAQAGTITASSEQTAYPADRLREMSLWSKVWRSEEGDLSAVDLDFDLGVARDVSAIALPGVNFTLASEMRVWFGNDPTFATSLWDSTQIPVFDTSLPTLIPDWSQPWGRNLIAIRTAGTVNARYGRLRIWDPTNPNNFLRAAIGLMEDVWQPIRNYATAYTAPDQLTGEEGVQQTIRGFSCNLHRLEEDDESRVLSLTRTLAGIGRLLLIPRPLKPSHWLMRAIWGKFTRAAETQGFDQKGRFAQLQLQFAEVDE